MRFKDKVNRESKKEVEPPRKIKLRANLDDSQNSSLLSSARDPNKSKNLVDNIIPSFTGKEKMPNPDDATMPVSILAKSYKRINVIASEFIKILVDEAEPQNPEDFIKL
jgi:hypothetical protein